MSVVFCVGYLGRTVSAPTESQLIVIEINIKGGYRDPPPTELFNYFLSSIPFAARSSIMPFTTFITSSLVRVFSGCAK